MDTTPKYETPWELITESLTGNLTIEGERQLQQWLLSDPANRARYDQIRELWNERAKEYHYYKLADENKGWDALQSRMNEKTEAKIIRGNFTRRSRVLIAVASIAAVFIGLIGIWIILSGNNSITYETASDMHKKIILKDGSTIALDPLTKIEVPRDYNKKVRKVIMSSGEASFKVEHRSDRPFIVELGATRITDIGTTFSIKKGTDEIDVTVTSGKVAFVKVATKESRELSAGTGITFDVQHESFGDIKPFNSSITANESLLNFDNTPLSDVLASLEKVYGKKVVLAKSDLANKKLTAKLGGMPYDKALQVICKSLGLEFSLNDSIYTLKEKQ